MAQSIFVKVLIVGAGPAGVQCAMSLDNQNIKTAIVNKGEIAGGLQNKNPYVSEWIATSYKKNGAELSLTMEKNLLREQLLYYKKSEIISISCLPQSQSSLEKTSFISTMRHENGIINYIYSDFVVLAMGVKPKSGGLIESEDLIIGPGKRIFEKDFTDKSVAILGGGDNAVENFTFIRSKNPKELNLFAKKIIARPELEKSVPKSMVTLGECHVNPQNLSVNGKQYDVICVFWGWEPNVLDICSETLEKNEKNHFIVTDFCRTSHHKIFAIGEINHHFFPSITQSMSEGMMVSKVIGMEIAKNFS